MIQLSTCIEFSPFIIKMPISKRGTVLKLISAYSKKKQNLKKKEKENLQNSNEDPFQKDTDSWSSFLTSLSQPDF